LTTNNVIDVLTERGFINQATSLDLRKHASNPIKAYVGFDPTADSLHLGNLMGIIALVWFEKFGHTPYVLIGGATAGIGDPSGKDIERPLLEETFLSQNIESLIDFFQNKSSFFSGFQPLILNNSDWLSSFSFIDFLRHVGKHFRIGSMLAKESVRTRIQSEEGMSFTEFSYQLLQSYDFYHLNQKFGISLQIGGSDQWGNITAGIELNRKLQGQPLYGLTFPLLTRSDGKKFGKTEDGTIWLSSKKLSPYDFYQYFFRIPDVDVIRLLKLLTFLDLKEIFAIEKAMKASDYKPNSAQKILATTVTQFVHGNEGVSIATRVTNEIAPGKGMNVKEHLSKESLKVIAADIPHTTLPYEEAVGQKIVEIALAIGLVSSKGEGVRLIKNGGIYLNNERIDDPGFAVSKSDLIEATYLLLGAGKRKKFLIEIISKKI